jgi:hypothetical protein
MWTILSMMVIIDEKQTALLVGMVSAVIKAVTGISSQDYGQLGFPLAVGCGDETQHWISTFE